METLWQFHCWTDRQTDRLEKLVGGNWNQSKFEKRQRIEFKKLELDDRRDREKDRGRGRYR